MADLYLRKGAQFTVNVETANPVIIAAYRRGQKKILKKMLKGSADPNATDKANLGKTPLGVAYLPSAIKLLLATDGIIVDKPIVTPSCTGFWTGALVDMALVCYKNHILNYSTVTDLAKCRGWSMSVPRAAAI